MNTLRDLQCVIFATVAAVAFGPLVGGWFLEVMNRQAQPRYLIAGSLLAGAFLSSSAMLAVLLRGYQNLRGGVLALYAMKVTMLFALVVILLQREMSSANVGAGVLFGGFVYVGAYTVLVVRAKEAN